MASFQDIGNLISKDIKEYFQITIAFHCSEMASLSDWTPGQSNNLKKHSKLLIRAFQITYFIPVLIYRCIRFKNNHLKSIFGF